MILTLLWLTKYISRYGYLAIFLIIFIGGTYLPIPAGLLVLAIGAFARQGYLNIILSFIVVVAANVLSDLLPFFIARKFSKGDGYKKYIKNHRFAKKIETYIKKYPRGTIFVSRFVGLIGTPVNVLAGLSQIPLRTFLLMDILGDVICTAIYMGIGYVIGNEITENAHLTTIIGIVLAGFALLYAAVFCMFRLLRE